MNLEVHEIAGGDGYREKTIPEALRVCRKQDLPLTTNSFVQESSNLGHLSTTDAISIFLSLKNYQTIF